MPLFWAACRPEATALEPLPTYTPSHDLELPIRVDGGDLEDAGGRVVVLNGDTPWSLAAQLDSAEVLRYLDTRAAQGVNALAFNAVEHLYADPAPLDAYGRAPFAGTVEGGLADLTTLDPAYWDRVEWIVAEARARDMIVLLVPAYVGYRFNDAGWSAELVANGPERLRAYGDSLGRRFGGYGNVLWVMGGDWAQIHEGVVLREEIAALAEGIRATDPDAILTAHSNRNRSALDSYDEPWLDVNTTYSDTLHGPRRLLADFHRTAAGSGRVMPTFWFEGYYENEHGMTDEKLRAQVYWSLLSGGSGHLYGAFPVWSFEAPPAERFGDPETGPIPGWEEALVSPAANDLVHARALIDSLPLHRLEPLDRLGLWPPDGDPRAPAAAWAPADSLLLAYLRDGRSVDLSAGAIHPGGEARWMDPRTGSWSPAEPAGEAGDLSFTAPSREDWVLVIRGFALR